MSWKLTVRGAHSQPIALDFLCPNCGPFSLTVDDRDTEGVPCVDNCGRIAERVMSAPRGYVNPFSVVTGGVAEAPSPMFLDTRPLAKGGMNAVEWRAHRDKIYAERRHKEFKEGK